MTDSISIRGLDKAAVLAALYNRAQPQGAGFIHYDPKPMSVSEAEGIIAKTTRFDYLKGRVMKVDLSQDDFGSWGYDRDNGQGAAQKVIDTLRASGDPNNTVITKEHSESATVQAMQTRAQLSDGTRMDRNGMRLGLDDLAEYLGPKVDKVLKKS